MDITPQSRVTGTIMGLQISATVLASHLRADGRYAISLQLDAPVVTMAGSLSKVDIVVKGDGSVDIPPGLTAAQAAGFAATKLTIVSKGPEPAAPAPVRRVSPLAYGPDWVEFHHGSKRTQVTPILTRDELDNPLTFGPPEIPDDGFN